MPLAPNPESCCWLCVFLGVSIAVGDQSPLAGYGWSLISMPALQVVRSHRVIRVTAPQPCQADKAVGCTPISGPPGRERRLRFGRRPGHCRPSPPAQHLGPAPLTRILLLGCAGSGKTTLARRLGARAGAPVICLDAIWQPQWTETDLPHFRALIATAHATDAWISDDNFAAAAFDLWLPRAGLVLWLDRPRWSRAWRAVARVFRSGEAHRAGDLPKVLRFIWGFDRINRQRIEAALAEHDRHVPVIRLRTDLEIETFLAQAPRAKT